MRFYWIYYIVSKILIVLFYFDIDAKQVKLKQNYLFSRVKLHSIIFYFFETYIHTWFQRILCHLGICYNLHSNVTFWSFSDGGILLRRKDAYSFPVYWYHSTKITFGNSIEIIQVNVNNSWFCGNDYCGCFDILKGLSLLSLDDYMHSHCF